MPAKKAKAAPPVLVVPLLKAAPSPDQVNNSNNNLENDPKLRSTVLGGAPPPAQYVADQVMLKAPPGVKANPALTGDPRDWPALPKQGLLQPLCPPPPQVVLARAQEAAVGGSSSSNAPFVPSQEAAASVVPEILRANAIIRRTEEHWDADEPRTTSERTARIHRTTQEMVETFTNQDEVGFEERLNQLMAEAEQREIAPLIGPRPEGFDRTHGVQTVGAKLHRERTPPPERRADAEMESSERTEGAALGPLGGPHGAPHPVNHPVSSDARAPQAAGSESDDEGRRILWKEVDEEAMDRSQTKLVVDYFNESAWGQNCEIWGRRSSAEEVLQLAQSYVRLQKQNGATHYDYRRRSLHQAIYEG